MVFLRDRIPGARLAIVAASHLAPIEVDLSGLLIQHIRSASGPRAELDDHAFVCIVRGSGVIG